MKPKYNGLTDAQVLASREQYGDNVLTSPPRRSLWSQFIEKFNDPLIKILIVALVLSLCLSGYEYWRLEGGVEALFEPLGIFVAIVLATLVGFVVEVNANKKFEILNRSNDDLPVKVMRNRRVHQVARRDVVVGDIVLLEAGERVPADGELIESVTMSVDESSLTGEPLAWKTHQVDQGQQHQSTYPVNKLFRGSTVMEGHGVMLVQRVGDSTEYGRVATQAQIESDVATPLMQQLDRLGRTIARASYLIALLVVVGRLCVFFIDDTPGDAISTMHYFIQTVMIAVTLIVVSVPEGLPMSITLSLALSMHRMLRTNNLVRRMHACETMGAATVICTDKTGTLTQNRMQVVHASFAGIGDDAPLSADSPVALNMACNSTAHLDVDAHEHVKVIGNPTEGALLLWLRYSKVDYAALRSSVAIEAQVPFSTERKYMATLVRTAAGVRLLLVKGAPEVVMAACGINDTSLKAHLRDYQRKAMRTLAFASAVIAYDADAHDVVNSSTVPGRELQFSGYVAISDPVRDDVPRAIADCAAAGVKVKIVTGDNPDTAREVARQVGIWTDDDDDDRMIQGADFAAMSDADAMERARKVKIMARARPSDKARLVELLQRDGEVVAVTGDGTNDAPALKKAQVGLSMGDGTHVAREAGDITILDNSFASINKAVLWGRSLYRNIQRFILFQLTVNVCACLVVGVGSFMCKQPPLSVTQMLWVNLIMDTLAALALASLPPNSIVMREPPRRNADSIITRPMMRFIVGVGVLFALIMITAFVVILHYHVAGSGESIVSSHITTTELTAFFTAFVMLQFWNMFNAKSFGSGHSAFHNIKDSKLFFAVMAVIIVGQVLIVQCCGPMFNVEPLTLSQWAKIVCGTSIVMWVGEAYHCLNRFRKEIV